MNRRAFLWIPFLAVGVAVAKEMEVLVSWYGQAFHGKKTANGEVFNQYGLTAAHPTLPFHTLVSVRNPRNGKSVIVRINDRGPFIEGRELDLSYRAARLLGIVRSGLARVHMQIIELGIGEA